MNVLVLDNALKGIQDSVAKKFFVHQKLEQMDFFLFCLSINYKKCFEENSLGEVLNL